MKSFAQRLMAYRDRNQWTTQALTEHLSDVVGRQISVRTVENWLQALKEPHPLWRDTIENAIAQ
jgi:hypothetical protein